jgi:ABC-2 type transport system ATP-binding protein
VVRYIHAVRDVSLTVEPGQIFGFLGPNGAGKTTTIKMCVDLIRPSRGEIRVFGRAPRNRAVKQRIGYLPEHPYFYDYLKPQEILEFFGRVFGLDRGERKTRIDRLLERVGLGQARDRQLRKFSKGMLQRLGVAQALINDPELLILDEPLSGLDPMGCKEIRDIIIEERRRGKTIFLSSHILSDIEHLCDKVAIVAQGRVVKAGALSELLNQEQRHTEVLVRDASPELRAELGERGVEVIDLMKRVLERGGVIEEVHAHRDSLEDLFLRESAGAA